MKQTLAPLFYPSSIAVIGASRSTGNVGYRIVEELIKNKYTGNVFPVNPKATSILDLPCYANIEAIPESIDLAIVVVPRDFVLQVIDECIQKKIPGAMIISAGFAEVQGEGAVLQEELTQKVQASGMRLIGPNCLGLINTHPDFKMNASFSPVFPPRGGIAMSSQSGALGLSILALAKQKKLGLSFFVSVGNKADVSGNDLMTYWRDDPHTKVILFYLESFKDPRTFLTIAREVSQQKPIICVKSGKTKAGQRAASSHTAALAGSDVPVEALFKQTGVIRAETLQEMFDLAAALDTQPLPQGHRVGIVTNAGGPGILCTDACSEQKLRVPELSEKIQNQLQQFLPAAAGLSNPVDMIASASPSQFEETIKTVLNSDEIDMLIIIYIPVGVSSTEDVLSAISSGVQKARKENGGHKPVLLCPMLEDGPCSPLQTDSEQIPTYAFPEEMALTLRKIYDYTQWKIKPSGEYYIKKESSAETVERILSQTPPDSWVKMDDCLSILKAYEIPITECKVASTIDEACSFAENVGFPVVAKLSSTTIVHKTEMNSVHLDLKNSSEVKGAFQSIQHNLEKVGRLDEMDGILIQPMLQGGVEVMMGMSEDPLFGPLVGFGLGGIHVELLKDVCFRVAPLTSQDTIDMIQEIKGYKLLTGYRGHPPADIEALQKTLFKLSGLVENHPKIKEIDLNPVIALPPGQGCRVVDVRIKT